MAKVIFLHLSVILFSAGACLRQAGAPPPEQTPPGADTPACPPGSRLQYTVNERPVRILLECILVQDIFLYIKYEFVRMCCIVASFNKINIKRKSRPNSDRLMANRHSNSVECLMLGSVYINLLATALALAMQKNNG